MKETRPRRKMRAKRKVAPARPVARGGRPRKHTERMVQRSYYLPAARVEATIDRLAASTSVSASEALTRILAAADIQSLESDSSPAG